MAGLENLWKIKTGEKIAAQNLSDRVRQMKKKMWLSDVEIEEIRNKMENQFSSGDTATDQNILIHRNQQINEQTNHQIGTKKLDTQRFRK